MDFESVGGRVCSPRPRVHRKGQSQAPDDLIHKWRTHPQQLSFLADNFEAPMPDNKGQCGLMAGQLYYPLMAS